MRNIDQYTITEAVHQRLTGGDNPRLVHLLTELVQSLHDFARRVQLTETELMQAIDFMTATGQTCDDKRQEFILLADVLGLSMLTVAQNNAYAAGATEATVFGPFYTVNTPTVPLGADIAGDAPGIPMYVQIQIRGLNGEPVPHATVDTWQADDDGLYDVQIPGQPPRARALLQADDQGRAWFKTIVPVAYPVPTDGPVGDILRATGRHPWRPAHVHFMIQAHGYRRLITHLFRDGDEYLDSDVVFGVRQSLVVDMPRHEGEAPPWGDERPTVFHSLNHDFVLMPDKGQA